MTLPEVQRQLELVDAGNIRLVEVSHQLRLVLPEYHFRHP
jgi:hypothetical protein